MAAGGEPGAVPSAPPPADWTPPKPLPQRLETARLVIRLYDESDARAVHDAISESRASLLPWLPWAEREHLTIAQSAFNIERFKRAYANPLVPEFNEIFGIVLGIFDKATGELVGGGGYNRIRAETHDAETGYWVRTSRRRHGLCTEATAAILSWGFTPQAEGGWGFRRIRILAAEPNAASRAVPRKLGLREELRCVRDRWVPGLGYCDTLGWGVLAEEWDVTGRTLKA